MAKEKPRHADFVGQVIKDPKSPPETLLLQGFPGASSEKGHTRLYFDAQLSSYIEIPDEAILHSKELSVEHSPLGGAYLWIKKDAQVIHGSVGPSRVKAAFLEGPIMGGAVGIPGPDWPGGGFPVPTYGGCPPLPTAFCPTRPGFGCPPPTVTCPTRPWTGCPLPTRFCPTRPEHGCPPPTPACPTRPIVCMFTHLPQCHTLIDCPQPTLNYGVACTLVNNCGPNTVLHCGVQTAMPNCIHTVACPSAVDACPSSLGCGFPGGFPGGVNQ